MEGIANDKNDQYLMAIHKLLDKVPGTGYRIIMGIYYVSAFSFLLDRICVKDIEVDMFSEVGTVITLAWTLSTSLIVFYLGLIHEKRYGILMYDIIVMDFGYEKIIVLALSFFFEFIFLILMFLDKSFIELFFCSVYQVAAVTYIFLVICRESSDEHVRRMVIRKLLKEIQENPTDEIHREKMFLPRVIYSTDYKNPKERDELVYLYWELIKKVRSCITTLIRLRVFQKFIWK